MLHMSWLFIGGGILFLVIAGSLFLYGMYRSMVHGQPVDWQGFALIITAMGTTAAAIMPIIIGLLRDRRIQRVEEIRAGVPPTSPLAPSDSSPPPETWPRPGENSQ